MKCTICGGQTPPGAKLCLPCRAALRRARDDTISELLPLPRRREAFAFSHSPAIGRAARLVPTARPVTTLFGRRLTSAQLHAGAVIAFVAAAGVMAFFVTRELQRERMAAPKVPAEATATVAASSVVQRVSPSTMLGAARDATPAAALTDPPPDVVDVAPPPPASVRRPSRAARPRVAAKPPIVIDPLPASATVEAPVVITLPKPLPAPLPAPVAPPSRAEGLGSALAKCTGDFFARAICEQRTRTQFCEGKWGQAPQCPAGIANDHGQ